MVYFGVKVPTSRRKYTTHKASTALSMLGALGAIQSIKVRVLRGGMLWRCSVVGVLVCKTFDWALLVYPTLIPLAFVWSTKKMNALEIFGQ